MSYYWEYQPTQSKPPSSSIRIIGVIVILMLIVATGLVMLIPDFRGGAQPGEEVRVAVVDSGVNSDFALIGRIVAERSFVSRENGYDFNEPSPTDSDPEDVSHGTVVATTIVQNSNNAMIVNAKVLDSSGFATTLGIIAAIEWAVEQNCSVINLSLGGAPTYGDPLEDSVEWAFSKGVVVVAAAGNDGQNGVSGTSIHSPSVHQHALSVGGLDEQGAPAYYTSMGPTRSRSLKPDISAQGFTQTTTAIYYGTSFASPKVAAAAVELIVFCKQNEIMYSPGSIMTALLAGATPLPYSSYLVGAGRLDLQASKLIMLQNSVDGGLPQITFALPGTLPFDFERLFYGDSYQFNIHLLTSGFTEYDIEVTSATPEIFEIQASVTLNQSDFVPLTLNIPADGLSIVQGQIDFVSQDYGNSSVEFEAQIHHSNARVAFDISHTGWSIDSSYGQFRAFYELLVENDISVNEIREGTDITSGFLDEFDAVFILDPCAWNLDESNPANVSEFSIPFSPEETQAYKDYFENGGGILVAGLSNNTLDIRSLNTFLNWTGFEFGFSSISNQGDTVEVTNITAHAVTVGVDSFDFSGAPITELGNGTALAFYNGRPVLGSLEGSQGGRMIATGTNFFLDNWGLNGMYDSDDNDNLTVRIALWLSGLL
ncbi:MAG: S8 family serine peptidase [Candidatus Thorarchaeota archaeon]|nr:MAG: S8 family serine peptidase [Candidatus Thorarchaeota archaeon]